MMLAHFQAQRSWGMGTVLLVIAAALLENYNKTFPVEEEKQASVLFSYFENREKFPSRADAAVILPLVRELKPNGEIKHWNADFAVNNVNFLNWGFALGRPIVNGYSGQRTKLMRELPGRLAHFPDQRSLRALSMIAGLRYIIYVSSLDPQFNPAVFSRSVFNLANGVKYLYGDSDGNHLLEYTGSQQINVDDFFLLAPAYPHLVLSLDLMAFSGADNKVVKLEVFAEEFFPGAPIAAIDLPADGSENSYSFRLPAVKEKVRPFRLTFETDEDSRVFMRRSSVQPIERSSK